MEFLHVQKENKFCGDREWVEETWSVLDYDRYGILVEESKFHELLQRVVP